MSVAEKRNRRAESFWFLCQILQGSHITDYRLAIDGGANVGAWSLEMVKYFQRVLAFEPVPDIFSQLHENCRHTGRIECYPHALLDHHTAVKIVRPEKKKALRSQYVQAADDGAVRAVKIDSLVLPSCGFIKLDLEGAEGPALLGATDTIAKYRPTLMIEVDRYGDRFGVARDGVRQLLNSWGYKMVAETRPDQVFIPQERA